jgi:DNA polymerase-1
MSADKKLFLLDGHALVYRAHFAFINRPLINSKGVNTSAITGFTRTLWDLLQNEKPTHIAVAFDPDGPTFRHDMFEEYKANREEQPEDIAIAFPYIRKIVEAFQIPIVTVKGYEADDVIGTLAKKAEKDGYTTYMVTPDKDFGQLVTDHILIYKPSRQGNGVEIQGPKEVCEKWNIERTEQVIDILALQGDSIDNIPGVPGIGAKTAAKLLAKYDSVEGLLDHIDELKGKQQEKVRDNADQARLSKELATIDIEVPIDFEPQKLQIDPMDKDALSELFVELEFRTLARSILGDSEESAAPSGKKGSTQGSLFGEESDVDVQAPRLKKHSIASKTIENTDHEYFFIDTAEKRANLIKQLTQQKEVCFDTETTNIDATQAELVGIAFSWKAHEGYYVPFPEDQKEAQALVDEFRSFFENPDITKVAQNLKYDALVLRRYGVRIEGYYFDTMIAHYLLEPELRHNMDYLAETYLEYKPVPIENLIGKKGKNQKTMRDVDPSQVTDYAAEDADITFQLKEYLEPKLKEEEVLHDLYYKVESPLVHVLVDMEYEGINLDSEFLHHYAKELKDDIAELEEKIHEIAGVQFNIGSPKQVGEVLFDKMGLPYKGRKTKSGQYSTNEDKLTDLAADYPIVNEILDYRGLTKLLSTYVEALPKMVHPETGRIHSSFNQALAATGRLSSNNPNLQNIPIRTEEGARVREAFIPRDKNHVLLAADYSQIELRLIAEISKDEAMVEAFKEGKDIHSATAARVFEVPYDEVTREQRYRAKTVNFSIIYGAGATNLSRQLNIKRAEAKELIEQYFKQYSGLKQYMDDMVEHARKHGYVKTLIGRRRHLRDINSKSSLARSNAERMAINTPIQGSAADMIKIAMVNVHNLLRAKDYATRMILQVHDELIFDVPKEELDEVKPQIMELMKNALPDLDVPILVEAGIGKTWREAH